MISYKMAVTNLKYEIPLRYAPASKQEGIADVHRQAHLFSGNGLSSHSYISTLCSKIPRQPQDQILQMSRSIPLCGSTPTLLNIHIARKLYAKENFGVEVNQTVYALYSTTIDLCLSVFHRAKFRSTKAAIKLHTLMDLRGSIPYFIHISDGKLHDVNVLDQLILEPGSFYIMDRGYLDFEKLYMLNQCAAFFVIRAKSKLQYRQLYSHPVKKITGLKCDQTIVLTGFYSYKSYPEKLRRIKYYDLETNKTHVFLTNNFTLSPLTITELYRCRWQIELFFKWIKHHLRIKSFFGTTENAVKTQILRHKSPTADHASGRVTNE